MNWLVVVVLTYEENGGGPVGEKDNGFLNEGCEVERKALNVMDS